VKTRVVERLRSEAARYVVRFACEDCAHFDGEASRCSLAYPAAPRRVALEGRHQERCKSFERE
jgi:hypothetical protein